MRPTQTSLDLTRYVSDSINNQTMHHHYHILYDIASLYKESDVLIYVEIGCYAGGSACLMLQRPNTRVISIDIGDPIPEHVVYGNIQRLNKHGNLYNYLKGNSQTQEMVDNLKQLVSSIDILFIDGDHSYQAVINDFSLYEGLVKRGGYIVFDDYRDPDCPGAKKAIDEIAVSVADRYDIIGCLPNDLGARPAYLVEGNDYIIRKI